MAAAAQQVALQRVAAASILPAQLQPAVLGKNTAPTPNECGRGSVRATGRGQVGRALHSFRTQAFTLWRVEVGEGSGA